jgi:hypothetical protein
MIIITIVITARGRNVQNGLKGTGFGRINHVMVAVVAVLVLAATIVFVAATLIDKDYHRRR